MASSAWSPPSSPDAATVDVNTLVFNVVSHLTVGESLVVVGNVAELGGWNVDVGAKMTWTEGDVWTAEVAIPNDSAAVEFKMVRFNEGSGVTTWQEGDNYRAEMRSGQTIRVDTPNAFVQSLEVRIVADRAPAAPKTPEVAAAADDDDADEATESAAKEPYRFVDVPYEEEMQILAPVTYRFEDVPVDEIDAAITAAPVPAEDVEAVEKLVVAETKSEEEIAVVAAMQSARKAFDEAAEKARAASEKARAAIVELNAAQAEDDEEAVEAARARADETSAAAVAAVQAAKLAKAEVATATSAVAQLAQEEAEVAMEKAAAAAVEASRENTDDITAADLKAKEEALVAAAEEKRKDAEAKRDELKNLAAFEFPEFEFELPEVDRKVAGTAVVGALGVAGLAAEADLASSLMQVGGEAAMTTAFAFLFANNMVFKKDRDRLMKGLESRQQFEEFLLSGQWMGKDSFASEVAKDTLVVFDPLGIADEQSARDEKASAKKKNDDDAKKAEAKKAKEVDDDEANDGKKKDEDDKTDVSASSDAANDAEEKATEKKKTKTITWSGFFGSKKAKKDAADESEPEPEPEPEPERESEGPANSAVPKPEPPEPEPETPKKPGDSELGQAFMAFGSDPKTMSAASESSAAKTAPPPRPAVPTKPPSGKTGYSSFRRTGTSTFRDKVAKDDSPQAQQYRKDMAAAQSAGVPYSTWVKKSKEDLSTLSWQELAERMKRPYQPGDYSNPGGINDRDKGPR